MSAKKTPTPAAPDAKKSLLEKIENTELKAREIEALVRLAEARLRLKNLTEDAREPAPPGKSRAG